MGANVRWVLAGLLLAACAGNGPAARDEGGQDASRDVATDPGLDVPALPDGVVDAPRDVALELAVDAAPDVLPDVPDATPPVSNSCVECHRDTARLLADLAADPLPPPPEGESLGEC